MTLHYTRNIPITSSRTWPKHKQSLFIVYAGDNCARDEIRRCQCDFERIVGIKRGTGADISWTGMTFLVGNTIDFFGNVVLL